MKKSLLVLFRREDSWNYAAIAGKFIGTAVLGILQGMIVVRKVTQAEYGQGTLLSYILFR